MFLIGLGQAPPLHPRCCSPAPPGWPAAANFIKGSPKERKAAVCRRRRMSTEHGRRQQSGGRKGRSSRDKKSRKQSRRKETYSMYIYKVLKQVRAGS